MRSLRSLKSKFKNQNAKLWYSAEGGIILTFCIVILHFDICILNFFVRLLNHRRRFLRHNQVFMR